MALTDNLISYYKLDESSGNAADSVGTNTGTNTDVTYGAAKINNGAIYDAAGDQLALPDVALGIATGFTFACWIKTASTAEQSIFCRDVAVTLRSWQFRVSVTSGKLNIIRFDAAQGVTANLESTAAVNTDAWVHVVAGYDTTNGTFLYINGAQDGSDVTAGGKTANNNGTGVVPKIGTGAGAANTSPMVGKIDELGVWTRLLTASEVSQLYNGDAGLQYPFLAGPANLKTYNTNLKANIKSINTNLLANIKSLDTNI